MWLNPQFPADLVTFTEEILNGKLHFLCSVLFLKNDYAIQDGFCIDLEIYSLAYNGQLFEIRS